MQVAGPGVPDVYQGSELWETSLVDPDNRRAVDFAKRAAMLAELDRGESEGNVPAIDASGAAKLLVTSRALRLRRDRPELFTRYLPVEVLGSASGHAIAFDRGGAIAVATRLPVGLVAGGGWGDTRMLIPGGTWTDALTGRAYPGGDVPLGDRAHDLHKHRELRQRDHLAGGLDAVGAGHADVHEHHIRWRRLDHLQTIFGIFPHPDALDAIHGVENTLDQFSKGGSVLDDCDFDGISLR